MNNIIQELKEFDIDLLFANSDKIDETADTQTYHAKLPENFLGLFDSIEYKVGLRDGKFVRHNEFKIALLSVTFYSQNKSQNKNDIKNLVNTLMHLYNITDDDWTDIDSMRIDSGSWRGRTIIQKDIVYIGLNEHSKVTFELAIYNKFMETIKA